MTDELMCSVCGKGPFKAKVGLVGHMRSHGEVQASDLMKLRNPMRVYGARGTGYRTIKMAYPLCPEGRSGASAGECQARDGGPGWWYRCEAKGHNPYFTPDHYGERIEEELGPPDAEGNREVLGAKTIKVKVLGGPNIKPVPYTGRHNGDFNTAMRKARGKGCRLPEEIGVAPMCQYSETGRDCYWQEGLRSYGDVGVFCSPEQFKAVMFDQHRTPNQQFPEVLNQDKKKALWENIPIPA